MTLVMLRKVPRDDQQWEKFHFNHYLDHRIILGVLASKYNTTFFMPPIWPVPGNNFDAKIAEFHQTLHDQMNAVSGINTSDMLDVDLSTFQGATSFIEPNYRDHFAFHQYVGVPV